MARPPLLCEEGNTLPDSDSFTPSKAASLHASLPQYFPSDDEALDFAGPFTDRAQFNVPVEFFGRIIFDKPVAAVNLDTFVGHPHGDFSGIKLGHRRLCRGRHALVLHPCSAMSEETRGINFGGHIGEFELDRLEIGDRPSE